MLEQIKTVTIVALLAGIVAFVCGFHYGHAYAATSPANHQPQAVASK